MLIYLLSFILSLNIQTYKNIKHPDCSGIERWPTSMAYVHLKNAGLLGPNITDFSKTKTVRLASEQIGDDLFKQVHKVTFTKVSGEIIEVITVNNASNQECSMSGVEVFIISKKLGP